jgi:glycosyltransferase involved in cell wall biosynthesis
MRILFVHQNFPAQFRHIAQALHTAGHEVNVITTETNRQPQQVPTWRYKLDPKWIGSPSPLARAVSAKIVQGRAAANAMLQLNARGYVPDLVFGHVGWGESFAIRDVWPKTKLVLHAEFYYTSEGANINFDPEFPNDSSFNSRYEVRLNNAPILLALADADWGVAPTMWQKSRFPEFMQSKIVVMHEGIDTDLLSPNPYASFTLPNGRRLNRFDEVITFLNRNLEPYRGYHIFMRALPAILANRPLAHAVIIGGDEVSYGPPAPNNATWKKLFFDEVKDRLPLDRVHFVGKIPYSSYVDLMSISAAHIYLTYPFVLSWSMLEAMSMGRVVIGSRTSPVEEVIIHGENGLLVDFFDVDGLSETVTETLANPLDFSDLRVAARQSIVDKFDLKRHCLPQWMEFAQRVAVEDSSPKI